MGKVRFIHLRNYRLEQEGGTFKEVPAERGGTTIAYCVTDSGSGEYVVVNGSVAKCHLKDNFNRKIGRLISEGRLSKGTQVFSIALPSPSNWFDGAEMSKFEESIADWVADNYYDNFGV